MEQKNFTHVRQLLGYDRFDDLRLIELVNDLYETAWLPLRNHFTPAMKLVEKKREGSKFSKTYDTPQTPCDRMLQCGRVSEKTKQELRSQRSALDPMTLSALIETKLRTIHQILGETAARRAEEWGRAGGCPTPPPAAGAGLDGVPAPVAPAPFTSTPSKPVKPLAKRTTKTQKTTQARVS